MLFLVQGFYAVASFFVSPEFLLILLGIKSGLLVPYPCLQLVHYKSYYCAVQREASEELKRTFVDGVRSGVKIARVCRV